MNNLRAQKDDSLSKQHVGGVELFESGQPRNWSHRRYSTASTNIPVARNCSSCGSRRRDAAAAAAADTGGLDHNMFSCSCSNWYGANIHISGRGDEFRKRRLKPGVISYTSLHLSLLRRRSEPNLKAGFRVPPLRSPVKGT